MNEYETELWSMQDAAVWTVDPDNPTLSQALASPQREKWMEALQSEINALHELDTFELVDRPVGFNIMKGKVICKLKRDELGQIERYKCRYVGCGYSQREGIDYYEHQIWAPTGQHATLRCLFVHAVRHNYDLRHVDISTAFLHGDLKEKVYLEQPPVLNDGTDRVWLLKKSLYGLKQAGRQWHIKLSEALKKLGFKRAGYDPALFCGSSDSGEPRFIFLWVDDLIIVAPTKACDMIAEQILSTFKGKDLGEAKWVLGVSVRRCKKTLTLEMSQERMIETCCERFAHKQKQRKVWIPLDVNQEVCPDPHCKARDKCDKQLGETSDKESIDRLIAKKNAFDTDAAPLSKAEQSEYMSIVGTIQYIAVVTRPDIAYAASTLARYMSCPTNHLMNCARRLLQYLNTTKDMVLRYDCSKCSEKQYDIIGYSDADFAGCSQTSRSTSGMVILYCGQPVYWRSKRQPIVTSSTTEAELVALNLCALQVQWLKLLRVAKRALKSTLYM
jgi:hypothetical protein